MVTNPTLGIIDCEGLQAPREPDCSVWRHTSVRPTHVETVVAADMLLVDSKTLLKSHSKKGNYSGIRPVRLPSRKLAWPLSEIEKLLGIDKGAK